MQKWEDASANIFGQGSQTTSPLAIDLSWPTDNTNEVYFADIESDGAIAVTTIWFTSRGNQILEWDMVFDDFNFLWSENGEEGKMDFENIAMHELGHAAGLGHPDDSCIDETMFRFASLGETKKQDLHDGDIAGINTLY